MTSRTRVASSFFLRRARQHEAPYPTLNEHSQNHIEAAQNGSNLKVSQKQPGDDYWIILHNER